MESPKNVFPLWLQQLAVVLRVTLSMARHSFAKLSIKFLQLVFIFCLLAYNFSHRIDHLSFGELVPAIINPLDGTEKIAIDRKYLIITVGFYM